MKLHELKAPSTGAFTKSIMKMDSNLSLGDIKAALRASDTKKFDSELIKKVGFASSFRRHENKVAGDTMTCTLEFPNIGMVSFVFKMKSGQVTITSMTAEKPKEEDDAAK